MIKNILERCSEAELGNILGWETLQFAKEITDGDLDIKHLSNAVFLTVGIDLIKSEKYRNILISRMTRQQLITVFKSFNNEINISILNDQESYSALKRLAEKYLYKFSDIMGMRQQWNATEEACDPTPDVQVITPTYPLYDYQVDISNKALSLINNSEINRALIHLPTGAGKTRTALNVVCEHLRKNTGGLVIWLADSEELCKQASDEFNAAWEWSRNNFPVFRKNILL